MTLLGWLAAIVVGVLVALLVRGIVFPRWDFPGATLGLAFTGAVGGALGGALIPAGVVGWLVGGLNLVAAILVAAAFTLLIGAICCCRCRRDDRR